MSTSPVEFPFVDQLPLGKDREEKSALRWLSEMRGASERAGLLLPVSLAGKILGVSRGRVHQLMDGDVLEKVCIDGNVFVSERSVLARFQAPKLNGRPKKEALLQGD